METLEHAEMLSWWPPAGARPGMAAAAEPHHLPHAAACMDWWSCSRMMAAAKLGALRLHKRPSESSQALAAAMQRTLVMVSSIRKRSLRLSHIVREAQRLICVSMATTRGGAGASAFEKGPLKGAGTGGGERKTRYCTLCVFQFWWSTRCSSPGK